MKIKYEEKFYSTKYPQGYTYIGIYIHLYGMNDMVVDSIYEDFILFNSEWPYSEQLQHTKSLSELSSDEKLRVIAGTRGGRTTISKYTLPRTQIHFAGVDIPNNDRLVPDWYINSDGPVSKLKSGNIMYSEYANKPLDHFEKLERYYGIPKSKFEKSATFLVSNALRSGVRKIFGLQALPLLSADITEGMEAAPPLELTEDITIEELEAEMEKILEDVKDVEKAEAVVKTAIDDGKLTKLDKVTDSSEEHKEKAILEGLEKRSKAAEAAAEAAIMRESATEASHEAAQQGVEPEAHTKTTAAMLAPGEVPATMKEGALEKEIDTSKVASTHKSDAAQKEVDPEGHEDYPPDYAKAVAKVFNNSQYDKEIYKMLTNPLLQNITIIPKIDEADVKDDIYNHVASKDAMSKPDSVDCAKLYLYDSYKTLIKEYKDKLEKVESEKDKKEITKRIDGYTKSMNDLEQQLITDGIINRDKVNVGLNAEQLQAIHGMSRGTTILFSMLRGEYFPKSNPNIPSYEMAIRDDTQPTDKIEDTTEYKNYKEILSVAAAHANNAKTLLRSIQGQIPTQEMRERYREYLAKSEPGKLKNMSDKDIEKEAKKIFGSKAGLYFQLADRMLDYLEENPRRGALSVKEYWQKRLKK